MVELKCEFSPLVFAELYRLLACTRSLSDSLAYRLQEIHCSLEWLDEAAATYEGKWVSDLQYITVDTVDVFALSQPGHAELATWILAGLRNTGQCYDLSQNLLDAVLQHASSDIRTMPIPLAPSLSPQIVGWTLGCVMGSTDVLPIAPAVAPSDDNVAAAYSGFVEHVLLLQQTQLPWPEMMSTATYWRGYGLAEGLLPELGAGGPALHQLIGEASRSMAPPMYSRMQRHFKPFVSRRHALSHVADDSSRPRFVEVIQSGDNWLEMRTTVLGLTQFVFQEVSKYLVDTKPKSVRPGIWDSLTHELQTW